MIIDTDVLIWHLRGNDKARRAILNFPGFSVSVVTYMELIQGMRNKDELRELRRAFAGWKTNILYINEEVSSKAMFLVERYFLSHSLEIADALIAATALVHGQPLLTANDKHYRVVDQIEVTKFRPK